MAKKLLTIGQMAKRNHTTVPTLRLYDQMGLLHPCYTDPETSYRYYDIRQNARFDIIQYMKELGMNLSEIRHVLEQEDIQLIEHILIRKREQLFEQVRQLRIQREAITRAIASIERYRKSPTVGVTSLEYIDQRKIYAIDVRENFYDAGIDAYEEVLGDLKSHMLDRGLPQVYFYTVGTTMKLADFMAQRFVASQVFAFVDDHFPALPKIRTLESGMYACIYLNNYDDEIPYAKRLLRFCQENNYRPAGDYICEELTELHIFDEQKRSMFLRLQVPISFEIDA